MSEGIPIAVTGATGALGSRVARRLATRDNVSMRLVVRDPGRAPTIDGAELAVASYADGPAMRRALEGIHTLYFVSGTEAVDRLEQHRTAVRAAADAGVQRVVYTSFLGAAPDATFTHARDHFHTEQALGEAGLSFVALRNSLYADVLPHFAADGVIRGPAGDGRLAPVARDDIADVSVAALLGDTIDGPLDVTGPHLLSLSEVAAILSDILGTPVRYHPETLDEAYASRAQYGAPDWEVDAWVSTYTAIARGEMATVSDTVERLAGHPPMSVRDYVGRVAPRITVLSWGQVTTEAGSFRDAKLWPGGGRNWDWTETGTQHVPGIQRADVAELLDRGPEIIILGRGQQERLRVTDEALAAAEERGVLSEVLATQQAVERYNTLVEQGVAVAALIHSTC